MTPRRAVWISAALACAVYATALRNGWALDDYGLVARNPAAHSISAAVRAAFSPYWPPQGDYSGGLYRPLVTLTYALDWAISGGAEWWFHLANVVLHALATALVVLVALRWLQPLGALAAGVVFAVHPVHVEAVANVAGRSEILATLGLLAAVLCARRYRTADPPVRTRWLALTLLTTAAALGSKEHAVVALGILGVDHWLDRPATATRSGPGDLYLAVAALTVAWLFIWRAVAGPLVAGAAFIPLRDLPADQRLAAVIPAQLDALRLLVWPFDLSPDYSPQVIPVRTAWSLAATVAAVASSALLALAVALRRRAPAVAFGILAGAATYLPTSNLLFASGVMLAERALYFAALAPALAAGWLTTWAVERLRVTIPAALTALAVVASVFAMRTMTRVPFWRDSRSVVVDGFAEHPENFSAHIRLAEALEQSGDSARALAHYLVAAELYDRYSFVPVRAGRLALALGRTELALALGRRARALDPTHPGPVEFLREVFLTRNQTDSALATARAVMAANPGNLRVLVNYVRVLEGIGAPEWQRLLAVARLDQARGQLVSATARLDSAGSRLGAANKARDGCWALWNALPSMRLLAPSLVPAAQKRLGSECRDSVQ